ncbi:hypothetical protein QW131_32735 [Roseibium salinum]|nr:hypothetical protein [Roseibium salinum]
MGAAKHNTEDYLRMYKQMVRIRVFLKTTQTSCIYLPRCRV